jgi:hypothetical protein
MIDDIALDTLQVKSFSGADMSPKLAPLHPATDVEESNGAEKSVSGDLVCIYMFILLSDKSRYST